MSLSTREIRLLLRQRYTHERPLPGGGTSFPDHVVVFEVPIDSEKEISWSGGSMRLHARRRIDAVAVGLTKASGNLVHGFEIKASRSDLLAELRDPLKSQAAVQAVDRWWLVLGDRALLRDGDPLPDGWGVLVPRGRTLAAMVPADPQPGLLDRRVLAGIVQTVALGRGTLARGQGYVEGFRKGYRRGQQVYRPVVHADREMWD